MQVSLQLSRNQHFTRPKEMLALALLLFLLLNTVNAHPQGASTKGCQTIVPFHDSNIGRQQGPSPYSITTSRTDQDDVLVTIKSRIGIPIQGFMLQARIRGGELGGLFESASTDAHTIDCGQPGDTVTHSSPQSKALIEVRWKPPLGYTGPVIFNATIAQNYFTFWEGVESENLKVSKILQNQGTSQDKITPLYYISEQSTTAGRKSDPFYDGCLTKKLCFGFPEGCVADQDCKGVVAVSVSGNSYEFELKAAGSPAWVGVGLSDDNKMGDDSVLECVKEGNSIKPYLSWTTPLPKPNSYRIANPQFGIQLVNGRSVDDMLYCKVLRNVKTTINGTEFDLVNSKYNLLVAAGTSVRDQSVGYHDIGSFASDEKIYLHDIIEVAGVSKMLSSI